MSQNQLERYRPTMTEDVLHSWASDAQAQLDEANRMIERLSTALEEEYSQPVEPVPQARELISRMPRPKN